MGDDVNTMRKGVALIVCSPDYTISSGGQNAEKLHVTERNGKLQISLKPSYKETVQYAGIFVGESVLASSSAILRYSKRADTLVTTDKLKAMLAETEKSLKTKKHQVSELRYFISTHDSLDEGYSDALIYRDSIAREVDDIKEVIRIGTSIIKNGGIKTEFSPDIKIALEGKRGAVEGRLLGGTKVAFLRAKVKGEKHIFDIPFFQIRRLLSYKFYSLIPVSNSILSPADGDVRIECASAMIDLNSDSEVIDFPSSDGSPLLDTNMRFLGIYSDGKYITSNRIFYEMKKHRWK